MTDHNQRLPILLFFFIKKKNFQIVNSAFRFAEKSKFPIKSSLKKNIQILKSSSYYETLSWPNPSFPKFYNIVFLKFEFAKICVIPYPYICPIVLYKPF